MIQRKKIMLLSLGLISIIGTTIVIILYDATHESKNVFEEIYVAEMGAATNKQHTPLSNTEYFQDSVAEKIDYRRGNINSSIIKEVKTEKSPYMLSVESRMQIGDYNPLGRNVLEQKIMDIESDLSYRNIEIKFKYHYIISSDGDSDNEFFATPHEVGLYISIVGDIDGKELKNVHDFIAYGISESELREQSEKELKNILNYWVDTYSKSKFKHDDFGQYDIVDKIRFLDDDREKELIERFKNRR